MTVELVVPARCNLGEGPLWDHRNRTLVWIEITPGQVFRFDPRTGENRRVYEAAAPVGCVALRASGGLVVAAGLSLLALDDDGGSRQLSTLTEEPALHQLNDGTIDREGRLVIGTVASTWDTPTGSLYGVDRDHAATRFATGLTVSNGIDWSPDGATMYFADSATGRIDAFVYDERTGTPSERRPLARIEPADGVPDGLCVDSEGCVWVALYGGSAVRCYSASGEQVDEIRLPASQITSCAFGGDDLADLYITTCTEAFTPAQLDAEPLAGSVFRTRPGARGLEANLFGG